MKTTMILLMAAASILYGQQFTEPIFNIQAIVQQPLDAKILSSSVSDGIVLQEVEFTSEVYQNNPVRIYGIVGFPEGAKKIPGILWCQPGMAPANRYMPEMFAKRGYVCMCITLPHKIWNPWAAFNTKSPSDANLTHFAIAQMRAITYLCSMPELDTEKIGVGGSSYGGFFSTLIAGADPRIKCGMSFFSGGNMALGTHLPQFTNLETLQDVDVWNRTIDPAFRLKFRKVPFLWAAASNDNWFYLPSVVKTYHDSIGEKRLAIVPLWEHGFPEEVDEQLFSWFDIYLKQTKRPYNSVSLLTVKRNKDTLQANWSFSGDNKIKKAEIVVSYGKIEPWKWWIHRDYVIFPAKIQGNFITGEIGVVDPDIDMLVFGNITDENGAITSTEPVQIKAIDYGLKKANCTTKFNLFQWKCFDEETKKNFARMGLNRFVFDPDVKKDNFQSIRLDPYGPKKTTEISFKLHHVPLHSHKLKIWLRAEKPVEMVVTVKGVELPDSKSQIVKLLRRQETEVKIPVYWLSATIDNNWKLLEIDCPYQNEEIEGYNLFISAKEPTVYWIDSIVFEPVWKKDGNVKKTTK